METALWQSSLWRLVTGHRTAALRVTDVTRKSPGDTTHQVGLHIGVCVLLTNKSYFLIYKGNSFFIILDHKNNTCYEREETEGKGLPLFKKRNLLGHTDVVCYVGVWFFSTDVGLWTNTVVVLALRLILMKIIVFNTLMTIYAVIKW